eukprot:g3152.t1
MDQGYSKEVVEMCRTEEKFLLRALMQIQDCETPEDERGWYYHDKNGVMYGPFPDSKMRNWFLKKKLHPDLQVRKGNRGMYVPVRDLGPDAFSETASLAYGNAFKSLQRVLVTLYDES